MISVVHEFAILYSSRLTQKDKRWSDGRLRYYEFNNKLEVLSEEMLLVVSDFYPHLARKPLEHGVFGDGCTYTLPGGKLILEFTEYLGCFERDLSLAFVKKEPAVKQEPGNPEPSVKLEETPAFRNLGLAPYTAPGARVKRAGPTPQRVVGKAARPAGLTRLAGLTRQPGPTRLARLTRPAEKVETTRTEMGRRETNARQNASPNSGEPQVSATDSAKNRLEAYDRTGQRFRGRIPPGSNRHSVRLWHDLGLER